MGEEEESEYYPVKSLHHFLGELDREWGKFRTASLIGIATSGLLIVFLIFRLFGLLWRIRNLGLRFIEVIEESIFLGLVAVFVFYEIHLLLRQYRFFSRWERRVGLLMHLEEKTLENAEEREGQETHRSS